MARTLPCFPRGGVVNAEPRTVSDVAVADGLWLTGLRCGELSSLLTLELPEADGRDLYRCDLAAQCTKSKVARPY